MNYFAHMERQQEEDDKKRKIERDALTDFVPASLAIVRHTRFYGICPFCNRHGDDPHANGCPIGILDEVLVKRGYL